MSEADNQATSILLPSARVAVFSRDQETLEAARNIENDWRFARVEINVDEGGVLTATEAYKEVSSPDLLIIQTDNIDDSFTDQLEGLAAYCDENTAAIIIGPVNDVYLYRKLIEMGVSDYLVRPVETKILADVLAKTLIERIGVTDSRLIAFIGAKGGVGTSVLLQAAAWGAVDFLGHKTMILDAAGGWSSLGVGIGFEPSTTLLEAARAAENKDEDSLKRMIYSASEKLSVLASGGDVMLEQEVKAEQLERLIDMIMAKYPVIMADLSHAPSNLSKAVLARANQIIVVSTPTLTSLRLARSLINEIKDLRGNSIEGIDMIINMQGLAPANEVAKGDLEKAMEFKVSETIAFDPKTFLAAESEGQKLTAHKTGHDIIKNNLIPVIRKSLSAHTETTEEPEEKSLFGGFLSKLKK